jgi:hypothetical protein
VFSTQPNYGEDFASELHQKLKLDYQMAAQHRENQTNIFSTDDNQEAVLHVYKK